MLKGTEGERKMGSLGARVVLLVARHSQGGRRFISFWRHWRYSAPKTPLATITHDGRADISISTRQQTSTSLLLDPDPSFHGPRSVRAITLQVAVARVLGKLRLVNLIQLRTA